MKRTTIMAPEELIERLHVIARREGVSLAEVIRQGLEWRAAEENRPPRFVGIGSSCDAPHDTGRRAGDITFEPRSWR